MKGKRVMQFDKNGELFKIWDNVSIAAKEGGFIQSCISNVCLGNRKTHRGFKWKFLETFREEDDNGEV